jgi:hypothetical protein
MILVMAHRPRFIVLFAALGLGWATSGVGADQSGRTVIAGVASAQGVRATMRATGFIVEELADSGGPVAQALVDPQDSKSFASLPYPGENAVAFPGVIAAVGGPTLPAYPFYASASTSEPEQEVGDPTGGYRLKANAAPGFAAGAATLESGGDEPLSGAWAKASVATEGNQTTSRGETMIRGLTFGDGALRIASLRSLAQTVYRKGSDPDSVTELIIEGGTAGPLSFTYGPDGLSVAQQGVPTPSGEALAALNEVIAPAGLSIGFVRAQAVAGGQASEVLVVEQAGDIANGSRSSVRYRIGEASSALVLGEAVPGSAQGAEQPPAGGPPPLPAQAPGVPPPLLVQPADPLPAPTSLPPAARPSTAAIPAAAFSPALSPPSILPVPEASAPSYDAAIPQGSVALAPSAPVAVAPRRISAVAPLSGLLVAGAAAMVAVALLWTKRGGLTP